MRQVVPEVSSGLSVVEAGQIGVTALSRTCLSANENERQIGASRAVGKDDA
jgi:hypothetical protein